MHQKADIQSDHDKPKNWADGEPHRLGVQKPASEDK